MLIGELVVWCHEQDMKEKVLYIFWNNLLFATVFSVAYERQNVSCFFIYSLTPSFSLQTQYGSLFFQINWPCIPWNVQNWLDSYCIYYSFYIFCDNYVPQWWVESEWVESDDELSWLFTQRFRAFYLICRKSPNPSQNFCYSNSLDFQLSGST